MQEPLTVQCPWCFEQVTMSLAVDDIGVMVIDCEICCRPWTAHVQRDEQGQLHIHVDRD